MAKKNTFYVTTPIYYTNSHIHVGAAYTTIAADILARWNRLEGKEVFFLTGTDEHGQKIQETAEKEGKKPKEFVDEIAKEFKEAFELLNISNNNFIRTTDPEHEKEVKEILQKLYDKKYIYKGFYEAYYCIGCEQYKTESELVDGKCPLHSTEPELRKEEAYLFKLSAFQDKLLNLIKKDELNIQPKERRKEIITFIEEGLKDISISRLKEKIYWGIELPFDKKHTTFVWIDAFWSYISGLKNSENKKKFWPVDVQLMAKDIIRVHATIWPAILLALDYKLPKTMFVHGYFTINGQKMSKSLGNGISSIHLTKKYGSDSLRYYLMRGIAFGSDGDFSEQALIDRHNNELANKLGNLISRVSTLAQTYGLAKSKGLNSKSLIKKVQDHFENLEFDKALNEIFAFIDQCNEYIQSKKPWETKDKKVLYDLSNAIKDFTILLSPFIPETAEKIANTFNFEISLNSLETPLKISKIQKAPPLFKKIEINEVNKPKFDNYKSYLMGASKITNSDLTKLEVKIVEEKKGGDKLLIIPNKKINDYLKLIEKKLDEGFWNEVVGNQVIFIFKFKGGEIKKFILSHENEEEIARLCSKFTNEPYEKTSDLLGYLLDNKFYSDYVERIRSQAKETNIKPEKQNINKTHKILGIMSIVEFAEWQKMDLRVGKIEKVEDIEGADKLYKLTINIGTEKRTILAGLKQHYTKDHLKGKKCIVIINLAPRKMKGLESQGMLLAAVSEDDSQVILLEPERDIKEGSKVR